MILISKLEYNILHNEAAAMERALIVLMNERQVDELFIGNVYLYRAGEDGDHVGGWFVDEYGKHLDPVNYVLAHDAKEQA